MTSDQARQRAERVVRTLKGMPQGTTRLGYSQEAYDSDVATIAAELLAVQREALVDCAKVSSEFFSEDPDQLREGRVTAKAIAATIMRKAQAIRGESHDNLE